MRFHPLHLVSGALVVMCATAPGSATGVSKAIGGQSVPLPVSTSGPSTRMHFVRTYNASGGVQAGAVAGPLGCTGAGAGSFIGGGYGNVGYGYAAGILSGLNNQACDGNTSVVAGYYNVIGGGADNDYSYDASIDGGRTNGIAGSVGGFIGGGWNNLISNLAPSPYYNSNLSAIAAGNANTVAAPNSFIGAGYNNSIVSPSTAVPNAPDDFLGAGYGNSIAADYAVIGGGYTNTNTGEYATIGGGLSNAVQGTYGAIGGGYNNIASGIQATVGGGYGNTASGRNAAIPGGAYNLAGGIDSFAAGNTAHAAYNGTFVWSDYSATSGITSTAVNQFLARAAGGFYLYSSANLKSGVKLAPGSGSWSNLSDRAAKTGMVGVDDARILAKVVSLPVSEWSYTEQGNGIRHLGPMAQDFRASFGLGEDDRHISAVDEEGVALAAIKGLQAEVSEKNRQLAEMHRTDEANFDAKYARLEQRLDVLEAGSKSATAQDGRALKP